MTTRTPEREQFLLNLFTTAIENGGMGFFAVSAYRWMNRPPAEAYAVIEAEHPQTGEDTEWRIDIDTMAKGLGVIRNAVLKPTEDGEVRHNRDTGERLGFGGGQRRELLLADRTNGDDGEYDVIGALAVLECALFGTVVYN